MRKSHDSEQQKKMIPVKLIPWIFLISIVAAADDPVDEKEPEKFAKVKPKGLSLKDVRFVVISQPNSYHKKRAAEFKKHFEDQIIHLSG